MELNTIENPQVAQRAQRARAAAARRRAQADARLREQGAIRVTLWLSPRAAEALDRVQGRLGRTRSGAVEVAVRYLDMQATG